MTSRLTKIKEKSCRIYSYILQQIGKSYHSSGSFAHSHNFAFIHKAHKLHCYNVQSFGIDSESTQSTFHSRNVSVMISTPNIYRRVKLSFFKLVSVIRYIRCKICRYSVCANQNVIFVRPVVITLFREKISAFKPNGTVFFIHMICLFKKFYCFRHISAFVKFAFKKPFIVKYAVVRQIFFHFFKILRQCIFNKFLAANALLLGAQTCAEFFNISLCVIAYIFALIAVFGKITVPVHNFKKTCIQRTSELVNLSARVIYVKLFFNVKARLFHNVRKTVTYGSAPCVAHVHRSCRVCTHKFKTHFFAVSYIAAAVTCALFFNFFQNIVQIRI